MARLRSHAMMRCRSRRAIQRARSIGVWEDQQGERMKAYVCCAAILLMLAGTASAESDWQSTCKSTSSMARQIMTLRQQGTDASKLVETTNKIGNPQAAKVTTQIIIAAYKEPRYQTPEMQQKSIDDFSNDLYIKCADELSGK